MKTINLLVILPGLLVAQNVFSQTNHVTLSDQYPAAGEKISLTYAPSGTTLDGKSDIAGKVYFLDNKNYPVSDLNLVADGKLLESDFTVPDSAKAFYIKLYKDDAVDNNNDAGYVYLVYKNQKPVPGAYASEAYMLMSGMGSALAKIKIIQPASGLALYKKEFDMYPESINDYGANYYFQLARSTDPADKAATESKITDLEKSGSEKDLQTAASMLTIMKKKVQADSVNALIKARYPNGEAVKTQAYIAFFSQPDLVKKDSVYNVFIKNYPANPSDKMPYQDILAAQLAEAYGNKGDWANADKYIALIKSKKYLPGTLNDVAYEMAKKGENLDEAAKMSKESLDILQTQIKDPQPAPYQTLADVKKSGQNNYNLFADTYALILFKQHNYAEALKYEKDVYDSSNKSLGAEEMEHYMVILSALGKYKEAEQAGEVNVKTGNSSDVIEQELKKDYTKLHGGDKGYAPYLASLQKVAKEKARAELAKQMINQPAPAFTLKDLDGNTVSLAGLKGKTVIVDFWATWCGPCKASFPGMQMAVTKFKNDPNVKFLFVDCWENGDSYADGVKKFIADNKYTFHVLLDEKGNDGRQSKVVSSFDVSGIPTKFIIDKNGNIRFKYVGYTGTPEALVEEISDMIDMSENPGNIPGQKVSMNK